ncbi:hypothetical protein D9613_009545 [Agrocybe pediades]|uniref:Uncharacterized protein n=1 Tax=Agrocybe pediades TaxID=84607 RepID=A0A8H4R421_9AGAR|nr:hypothetical protein D9613_009545 [Agrocybe pediades]
MQQFPHPLIILDLNLSAFADGVFVGFILSTIFFGVTLLQAWNYALSNKDGWIMRTLVASLVALDITTTSNNVLLLHTYLIQHFGNLLELTMSNISFIVEIALTATVVFLVQLFFASRVYILNHGDYRLPCAIVATACLGFVCSCYAVNTEITHREVADLTILPIKVTFILGQSLVTTSDGITTLALSVNFIRARSEINTKNIISILESLLAAVVARGVLVTVSNGILILLYILYPLKLYWLAVQFMQSKLYIITLIAMYASSSAPILPRILNLSS